MSLRVGRVDHHNLGLLLLGGQLGHDRSEHTHPAPLRPAVVERLRRTILPGRVLPHQGEWNARKHGGTKRRVWRKIHIGIDEQTLEIRATEFITSDVGGAPMLPELLDQIPPDQEMGSVTADGAYDTRKCHDAIAAEGAAANITPRKNAKPWKPDTPGAIARNEALRASQRFG